MYLLTSEMIAIDNSLNSLLEVFSKPPSNSLSSVRDKSMVTISPYSTDVVIAEVVVEVAPRRA